MPSLLFTSCSLRIATANSNIYAKTFGLFLATLGFGESPAWCFRVAWLVTLSSHAAWPHPPTMEALRPWSLSEDVEETKGPKISQDS